MQILAATSFTGGNWSKWKPSAIEHPFFWGWWNGWLVKGTLMLWNDDAFQWLKLKIVYYINVVTISLRNDINDILLVRDITHYYYVISLMLVNNGMQSLTYKPLMQSLLLSLSSRKRRRCMPRQMNRMGIIPWRTLLLYWYVSS